MPTQPNYTKSGLPARRKIFIHHVPGSTYPYQIDDSVREPDGSWRPVVRFCYQDPTTWVNDAYCIVTSYQKCGVPLEHNLAIEEMAGAAP